MVREALILGLHTSILERGLNDSIIEVSSQAGVMQGKYCALYVCGCAGACLITYSPLGSFKYNQINMC